jgi:hypothetical protein
MPAHFWTAGVRRRLCRSAMPPGSSVSALARSSTYLRHACSAARQQCDWQHQHWQRRHQQ